MTDYVLDSSKRDSAYHKLQNISQGSGSVSEYYERFVDLFRSTNWYEPYNQGIVLAKREVHKMFAQGLHKDLMLTVGNLDGYNSLREIASAASSMESTLKERNKRDQGEATLQLLMQEIENLKAKTSFPQEFYQAVQHSQDGTRPVQMPYQQAPPPIQPPQVQLPPQPIPQVWPPQAQAVPEPYARIAPYPYVSPLDVPVPNYHAPPLLPTTAPYINQYPSYAAPHYGHQPPARPSNGKCSRCGQWGHSRETCRISARTICHYCHKPGHVLRACRTRQRGERPEEAKQAVQVFQAPTKKEEEEDKENDSCYPGTVNGAPVDFFVDGGSQVSTVSKSYLDEHLPQVKIEPTEHSIRGVGGVQPTLGEVKLDVKLSNLEVPVKFQILETDLYSVLVGKDVLRKYGGIEDHGTGRIYFSKIPVYLPRNATYPRSRQELKLFLQNFKTLPLKQANLKMDYQALQGALRYSYLPQGLFSHTMAFGNLYRHAIANAQRSPEKYQIVQLELQEDPYEYYIHGIDPKANSDYILEDTTDEEAFYIDDKLMHEDQVETEVLLKKKIAELDVPEHIKEGLFKILKPEFFSLGLNGLGTGVTNFPDYDVELVDPVKHVRLAAISQGPVLDYIQKTLIDKYVDSGRWTPQDNLSNYSSVFLHLVPRKVDVPAEFSKSKLKSLATPGKTIPELAEEVLKFYKARLVNNYVQVNLNSKTEPCEMPDLQAFRRFCAGKKIFSSIDFCSSFYQRRLTPRASEALGINTIYGFYTPNFLPFGHKNAPSDASKLLKSAIAGIPNTFGRIDDLLIATETLEQHLEILEQVMKRLEYFNIKTSVEKSFFCQDKLEFMGYIVGPEGIYPQLKTLDKMREAQFPSTRTELQSFLGLANWLIGFTSDPEMVNYMAQLTDLLRWSKFPAREKIPDGTKVAFEMAKKALFSPTVLVHPRWDQEFYLTVDASERGVQVILHQDHGPIGFKYYKFSEVQRRWPTIEREAWAIVFGIQGFKDYLMAVPFTVRSDHRPLQYLREKRFSNAKIQRWFDALTPYCFRIHHIAGKTNIADYGSRYIQLRQDAFMGDYPRVYDALVKYCNEEQVTLPRSLKNFVHKHKIKLNKITGVLTDSRNRKVPTDLNFLRQEHVLQKHLQAKAMFHLISKKYVFPRMWEYIQGLVRGCDTCQRVNFHLPSYLAGILGKLILLDLFLIVPTSSL